MNRVGRTRPTGRQVVRFGVIGAASAAAYLLLYLLLRTVTGAQVANVVALVVTQAACRAPAIPACLSVVSSVVAAITLLWLLFRVVLDPGPHQQAGAWVELLGGLVLLVGSYWSLRQEGIAPEDGPGEIPVLTLSAPSSSASSAPATTPRPTPPAPQP